MTLTLPPPIAALIEAHNRHDREAFITCVADDATFRDEGRVHHGRAAILAWFDEICRRYQAVLDVSSVEDIDGETVIVGRVSGAFEGSPVTLRYVMATEADKVIALRVRPLAA
jgi:hypothetical protein